MTIQASAYVPTLGAKAVDFSGTSSEAIDTQGATALAIFFPAGWNSGDITFSAANPLSPSTFSNPIKNSSGVITYTGIVAGDWVTLAAVELVGIESLKIISSVSQTVSPVVVFGPVLTQQNIG